MSDKEFFAQIQEDWYTEFVDAEVREIRQATIPHEEIFLLDIPF